MMAHANYGFRQSRAVATPLAPSGVATRPYGPVAPAAEASVARIRS